MGYINNFRKNLLFCGLMVSLGTAIMATSLKKGSEITLRATEQSIKYKGNPIVTEYFTAVRAENILNRAQNPVPIGWGLYSTPAPIGWEYAKGEPEPVKKYMGQVFQKNKSLEESIRFVQADIADKVVKNYPMLNNLTDLDYGLTKKRDLNLLLFIFGASLIAGTGFAACITYLFLPLARQQAIKNQL